MLLVSNHKESPVSSEKLQSKSKKKSPQQKSTQASKKNSTEIKHGHTNGLVSSDKKVPSKNNNKINVTVTNGNEDDLEDELLEKIREENMETRNLAFKEIRRLGRDYSGLYEQLAKIKGSFDIRFSFIRMCIDEACRFRRKHMADCIEEWWASRCDEDNVVVDEKKPSSDKKKRSTT